MSLALTTGIGTSNVSWSAFHASHDDDPGDAAITTSCSFAFVSRGCCNSCYGETLAKHHQEIVDITNPGLAPVVACDQSLFAIAKKVRWKWPLDYGEDKFVIMFGGLHIELAALKTLGDLLKVNGWTSALVQAGVTTAGTADSFLKSSPHHPNTTCSPNYSWCLMQVLEEAYQEYTKWNQALRSRV